MAELRPGSLLISSNQVSWEHTAVMLYFVLNVLMSKIDVKQNIKTTHNERNPIYQLHVLTVV